MKAASVGPINAPIVVNSGRPGIRSFTVHPGRVSGRRPKPFLASKSGRSVIQAPANARTKKAINGCLMIRRLRGEEVAGGDGVVMVDMLCFLSLQESPAL
jgi:hypothetical protein